MTVLGGQFVVTSTDDHSLIPDAPTGKVTMYHYSGDGLFYVKDSSGTFTAVGSPPGAGVILQDGTVAMAGDFQLLNNAFILDDISTPSTPSSGLFKTYLKSDGNLYLMDDTGTEKRVVDTGSGILKDGTIAFTGELKLGAHDILIDDIATPATPSSGLFKLYLKSDGKLYTLDDAATETQVGGGNPGSLTIVFDDNESIPDSTATDLTYSTTQGSLVGDFDLSSSPDIKVTSPSAGNYLCQANFVGNPGVFSMTLTLEIFINGTRVNHAQVGYVYATVYSNAKIRVSIPLFPITVVDTDIVNVKVTQDSGATLSSISTTSGGFSEVTFLKVS